MYLQAEMKFTGNQEIVGAKLNCEEKKDANLKSILILNRDVKSPETLSARAALTTRTSKTSAKRTQAKKDTKQEVEVEKKQARPTRSSNRNKMVDKKDEICDDNDENYEVASANEDDDEYKPERKKRTSGQRRGKAKSKASSESESDEDRPVKRLAAAAVEDEPKPNKIATNKQEDDLKLSESDDEDI